MFKSFCKNQKVINIALVEIGKTELVLSEMEKILMEEFLKFLEIKYPTINTNIVFFEKIHDTIEKNEQTVSFEESVNIYSFAKEKFHQRFKIHKIHLVAALLDPIQKNWTRLNKWLRKVPLDRTMDLFEELGEDDPKGLVSRQSLILTEVMNLPNEVSKNDVPTTSGSAKKQRLETNQIRNSIASFVAVTSTVEDVNPLEKEIKEYFDATHEHDCETFTWWKKHEKEFPNIANLAAAILSIPSTSASAEEAFSSAGSLITSKRSNLSALTINKVLFIHDNYEMFNHLIP